MTDDQKAEIKQAASERKKARYWKIKTEKMVNQPLAKFKSKHHGKSKAKIEAERKAKIADNYKAIAKINTALTNQARRQHAVKRNLTRMLGKKLEAAYDVPFCPHEMSNVIAARQDRVIQINEQYTNHPS